MGERFKTVIRRYKRIGYMQIKFFNPTKETAPSGQNDTGAPGGGHTDRELRPETKNTIRAFLTATMRRVLPYRGDARPRVGPSKAGGGQDFKRGKDY